MNDIEAVIEHGFALALDNGQADPTLRQAVWELLLEASDTLKRLPDRELGWLRSCERSHHPEIVREAIDHFVEAVEQGGWADVRVDKGPPTKDAITRLDEVLTWPAAVGGTNRRRDIGVLYALAMGTRIAVVRRRFGIGRTTVYDIRDRGLDAICRWLEKRKVAA